MPAHIELVTTDYPGRGSRMAEGLLKDVNELVTDMYQQIKHHIDAPYMIYGHSMGGLVAYKMLQLLRTEGKKLPDNVLITGCRAPSSWDKRKRLHDLPYDELVKELTVMGGVPQEILKDKDSMLFFEPIMRADFSVVASHIYQKTAPFSIPFKIITGTQEEISQEDALKWQEETTIPLSYERLEGGHFFIFDHPQKIAEVITACFQKNLMSNTLESL